MRKRRSLTGFIPSYANARRYLRILDGESRSVLSDMKNDIDQHRGSQKQPANWKKPDRWIPERLEDASRRLALKIWIESNRAINPAHLKGFVSICHRHSLLSRIGDKIALTREGNRFLNSDDDFIMQMDRYEGMFLILNDLVEKGPGQNLDILDGHRLYCLKCTGFQSDKSITTSHVQRLQNLSDRGYVDIDGKTYRITSAGSSYLKLACESNSVEPMGL